MRIPKSKVPKIKDLQFIGTKWYKEKGTFTKVSVYNIKEEVEKKPQGDGTLTNEQFNQIINRFDGLESKVDANSVAIQSVKEDVQVLKTDVKVLKTDVKVLKTDVQVLKTDVKALNSRIDNLVDKNDLSE